MENIERKIIINPTSITITNFNQPIEDDLEIDYKKLLNQLSVWGTTPYGGKIVKWKAYFIKENDLIIHRGINLYYIFNIFPTRYWDIIDNTEGTKCYANMGLEMKVQPREKLQEETIEFMLNDDIPKIKFGDKVEISDINQKFVCLKPGKGKTYCAINYITKKNLLPIIIVDNNKILNQWKESVFKFTNIKEEDIYIISGSDSIRKLLKQDNINYKIYFGSHRTFQSYSKEDLELLSELFLKIGVGIKIFDEAHVEWKSIFNIDIHTNVKYTIYLTATPKRSDQSEQAVYKRMFYDIRMFGLKESIKNDGKYIYYVECLWNSNPNSKDLSSMSNNYGFDSNRYNNYILENDERFNKFTNNLYKLISLYNQKFDKPKIAIVVNCNNMIERLYNYFNSSENPEIAEMIKSNDIIIGQFCGLIDKSKREKELDKDLILTTVKGFNKGVDVDKLQILINTVSISSEVIIEQLTGRLRYDENLKKYFIQFVDVGFNQCKQHAYYRNKFINNKIAKKSFIIDLEKEED